MVKLTIIYGHPVDTIAFENYYANTHLPLASKMKGISKTEYTKFVGAPDGSMAAHYRMAEFWFADQQALQTTMGSPEGKAAAADLANFATGNVTILVGVTD